MNTGIRPKYSVRRPAKKTTTVNCFKCQEAGPFASRCYTMVNLGKGKGKEVCGFNLKVFHFAMI